jgi:hypothetical protein
MNIVILNGNPEPSSFDFCLDTLKTRLEDVGNQVVVMDL